MSSVTQRIKEIEQPKSGYLPVNLFTRTKYNDGITLKKWENVHPANVGLAVDYLTRNEIERDLEKAFDVSLRGAIIAEEEFGKKGYASQAFKILDGITGLDDNSIKNACLLTYYDAWYRDPIAAMHADSPAEPDKATIDNIRVMTARSVRYFMEKGLLKTEFTFFPDGTNEEDIRKALNGYGYNPAGIFRIGGYTETVDAGDGDYLTEDTMYDLKVIRKDINIDHTLQVLMYYIMGKHSGRKEFQKVKKLGIYNPRLNFDYILDVSGIDEKIISDVEQEVIGY